MKHSIAVDQLATAGFQLTDQRINMETRFVDRLVGDMDGEKVDVYLFTRASNKNIEKIAVVATQGNKDWFSDAQTLKKEYLLGTFDACKRILKVMESKYGDPKVTSDRLDVDLGEFTHPKPNKKFPDIFMGSWKNSYSKIDLLCDSNSQKSAFDDEFDFELYVSSLTDDQNDLAGHVFITYEPVQPMNSSDTLL